MIKINGVQIPTPSSYRVGIMDISGNAERTASGLMVRDIIATKRKIELSWNYLSQEDVSKILNLVSGAFFKVEYIDPQDNTVKTGIFYAGDRTVEALDYRNGRIRYQNLKFNLIER